MRSLGINTGLLVCLFAPCLPTDAAEGLPAASAHALALLAPVDRWVTRVELRRNGYDQWYDSNGRVTSLGARFDNIALDSAIFPALSALGGGASLGTTQLSSEVTTERYEFTFGYGLSEDLTIGTIFNFGNTRTQVQFDVADGNTGWNPLFDPTRPIEASNFPFAPASAGAPMTTADVNQILTDPAFGFAYKPVATTGTSAMGEAIVGGLWRFHKSENSSLVWGLGYRKGLADANDPDDLFDAPLDDGSDDWLTQLEYFRGWNHYDLRVMAKHVRQTKDRATLRVPAPGEALATAASKERLDRDMGDFWEYDLEMGYRWGAWRIATTWHLWRKSADRYTSARGQDTSELEANTDINADQWRLALSWSGIDAWRSGRIGLPLIAKLELQETYGGRNMPKVRDLYLVLTTFF